MLGPKLNKSDDRCSFGKPSHENSGLVLWSVGKCYAHTPSRVRVGNLSLRCKRFFAVTNCQNYGCSLRQDIHGFDITAPATDLINFPRNLPRVGNISKFGHWQKMSNRRLPVSINGCL